jgi:hypothetical protein
VAIGAVAALLAFALVKYESQQKAFAWYVASVRPNAGDRIEIAPQVGVFDWTIYDRVGDDVRGLEHQRAHRRPDARVSAA